MNVESIRIVKNINILKDNPVIMKKALFVIDMVKGFTQRETSDGPCAVYVEGAKSIIPVINEKIKLCEKNKDSIYYISDHLRVSENNT